MATSLQPTRYESVHAIPIIADEDEATRKRALDFTGRVKNEQSQFVLLSEVTPSELWSASLNSLHSGDKLAVYGATPDDAKRGLAHALRKIAAELDEARIG